MSNIVRWGAALYAAIFGGALAALAAGLVTWGLTGSQLSGGVVGFVVGLAAAALLIRVVVLKLTSVSSLDGGVARPVSTLMTFAFLAGGVGAAVQLVRGAIGVGTPVGHANLVSGALLVTIALALRRSKTRR